MKNKTWILVAISLFLLSMTFALMFTLYLVRQGVPLRFSNSISYDAKLNFIHNTRLLDKADTLVVGASMALSDVSGVTLEEDKRIGKVANISSWGLHSSDILRQLEMIDLSHVKTIIFATQFLDFDDNTPRADIDQACVKRYLSNKFDPLPYVMTMETILPEFMTYVRYKTIHMDSQTYSYLDFDTSGSALYANEGFKILKFRWDDFKAKKCQLIDSSFTDLDKIAEIAKRHDIRLIVITTPIREEVLSSHPPQKRCYQEYVSRLSSMSDGGSFDYLNINASLRLQDNYFVDKIHLNIDGAKRVSQEILREM